MRNGVRQGGKISPLLWIVSLNYLIRPLVEQWRGAKLGFKIEPLGVRTRRWGVQRRPAEESIPSVAFADDLTVIAE
eukprot:13863779-Alexandrium_andersonii.AAC.1